MVFFNDAQEAIKNGIFSVTSISGYSITKSLVLYGIFLIVAIIVGLLFKNRIRVIIGKLTSTETEFFLPKLLPKEWVGLCVLVAVTALINIGLEPKLFNWNTFHTEEFYNLAALNEFNQGSFSIVYPYSVGHLIAVNWMREFGFHFIYYKILINCAALVGLYYCISTVVKLQKLRWFCLIMILTLFFLPWAVPTLHANLLRFFLPVFFTYSLFGIFQRYYQHPLYKRIIAYSGLLASLLFFGSADNIVIGTVLYGLFVLWEWQKLSWIDRGWFFLPPLAAVVFLEVATGFAYVNLLASQLQSISMYSGHPNAMPYFSISTIFSAKDVREVVIQTMYTVIFYVPFILMAGLIACGTALWSYEQKRKFSIPFASTAMLFVAYILNYRQSFANAGSGRVITASIILVFIISAIRMYYPVSRLTKYLSIITVVFFGVAITISLYFLRYTFQYLYSSHTMSAYSDTALPCKDTIFAPQLTWAGFRYCDKSLVDQLEKIQHLVGKKLGYVYDDTFTIYYLLGIRPTVLIPTYYMGYTDQATLVAKMAASPIEYMVYPKEKHFFGVPIQYINDPHFMALINDYRKSNFSKITFLPDFEVYTRQ